MNESQEPMRWDAGESDAPEELKRALAALAAADQPRAAELQRVRLRLQTVFEALAPRRLRRLQSFGGSVRTLAIGLVFLGGLFGWFRYERGQLAPPEQPSDAVEAPGRSLEEFAPALSPRALFENDAPEAMMMNAPLAEKTGAPAPAAVSLCSGTAAAGTGEGRAAIGGAAMRVPDRRRARVARPRDGIDGEGANRTDARNDVVASDASRNDLVDSTVLASERAATVRDDRRAQQPANSLSAAARGAAVPGSDPRGESPRRVSATVPAVSLRLPAADGGNARVVDEATLLQRARRAASADPEAALRLLEEHKRRFPAGMLSPEREVFAIDLLRSLSRTREANRRARDFRRDYPKSVYLSRIKP